jgi:MFS family permease
VLGFAGNFFASAFVAPVNAAAQSMVPSTMRGFTAAVLLVIPTIFGIGIGTIVTGAISDYFAEELDMGLEALRYAMPTYLLASCIAAAAFLGSSRHLNQDIPDHESACDSAHGRLSPSSEGTVRGGPLSRG